MDVAAKNLHVYLIDIYTKTRYSRDILSDHSGVQWNGCEVYKMSEEARVILHLSPEVQTLLDEQGVNLYEEI